MDDTITPEEAALICEMTLERDQWISTLRPGNLVAICSIYDRDGKRQIGVFQGVSNTGELYISSGGPDVCQYRHNGSYMGDVSVDVPSDDGTTKYWIMPINQEQEGILTDYLEMLAYQIFTQTAYAPFLASKKPLAEKVDFIRKTAQTVGFCDEMLDEKITCEGCNGQELYIVPTELIMDPSDPEPDYGVEEGSWSFDGSPEWNAWLERHEKRQVEDTLFGTCHGCMGSGKIENPYLSLLEDK